MKTRGSHSLTCSLAVMLTKTSLRMFHTLDRPLVTRCHVPTTNALQHVVASPIINTVLQHYNINKMLR